MAGHRRKGFGSFAQVANLLRIGGIAASHTAKYLGPKSQLLLLTSCGPIIHMENAKIRCRAPLPYIAYSLPCISASNSE